MQIIPAIDLRAGAVVRLEQGDFARQKQYQQHALALARRYRNAGARYLHVVDLDAASGAGNHAALIEEMAAIGLDLQTGGGIRSRRDVQERFALGVQRVIVGSLALAQPARVLDWIEQYGPKRIVLAVDCRWHKQAYRVLTSAWRKVSVTTPRQLLARYQSYAGLAVLCTDVARDGMLRGPNVALYGRLVRGFTGLDIQASGGVSRLCDLHALQDQGVSAVIVGKALLEQRLPLSVLAC